jgi:hypothetical protein
LRAGVELVETVVGRLRDHQCPPGGALVFIGGVQSGVLRGLLSVVKVHEVTCGVALQGGLVLAVAEVVLVAGVVGVLRAEVVGQLHVRLVAVGGNLNVGP